MAKSKLKAHVDRDVLAAHLKHESEGMVFVVTIKPNAATERLEINAEDKIILSVRAQAVEGAANERVRELLAEFFNTAKTRVVIVRGEHSRTKKILIRHP